MKNNKIQTGIAVVATLGSLLCFSMGAQAENLVNGSVYVVAETTNAVLSPFGTGWLSSGRTYDNGYRTTSYVAHPDAVMYEKRCDTRHTHFDRVNNKWKVRTHKVCNYMMR